MVTLALRSSYVSLSVVVMVNVFVPLLPLVGETVHHDTARPSVTSIVQSAVEEKVTDAVPPSCARTGAVVVTSIFGFSSGLGVGVGIGSSSPPEQLQQQTIIVRSKMRRMSFILYNFKLSKSIKKRRSHLLLILNRGTAKHLASEQAQTAHAQRDANSQLLILAYIKLAVLGLENKS